MPKKDNSVKLKIVGLSVKNDDNYWQMIVKAFESFEATKSHYTASILVDNDHFDEQVKEVQEEIAEVKSQPDMFEDWKKEIARLEKSIDEINKQRKDIKSKEIKDFTLTTEVADYKNDTLKFSISEEQLLQIAAIRKEFNLFVVQLN